MVEDHKKSESESESEKYIDVGSWKVIRAIDQNRIDDLERRVVALEKALMHVQHTNTDDGSKHQNDGGWFD